ncbi:MAG: hypothetical protein MZV70_30020, partial [Desulfobacterales bacterium]|nr:hypothetical protein [Desulfobacterales bacterium]
KLRIAKVNTKTPTTFFSTYDLRGRVPAGHAQAGGAEIAGSGWGMGGLRLRRGDRDGDRRRRRRLRPRARPDLPVRRAGATSPWARRWRR